VRVKIPRKIFIAGAVALGLLALGAMAVARFKRPTLTPAMRGREAALKYGCFACHGPGGTGGIPNPGSKEKEVPSWDGGTAMMYVKSESEISEWILHGHPERLEGESHDREEEESGRAEEAEGTHGRVSPKGPPLHMPAFEGIIPQDELSDIVAYFKAVSGFGGIPDEPRRGLRVASRLGCFGCHGPGGRVGQPNPGSFKGYVPPWEGEDFRELVRNEEELKEWILRGVSKRMESNPLARFFMKRQVIKMPAYEGRITESQLQELIAYIEWLQESRKGAGERNEGGKR